MDKYLLKNLELLKKKQDKFVYFNLFVDSIFYFSYFVKMHWIACFMMAIPKYQMKFL
jgi:hypothetical protein